VFEIDLEHCPDCCSEIKVVADTVQSAVIETTCTHLGAQAQVLSRHPQSAT